MKLLLLAAGLALAQSPSAAPPPAPPGAATNPDDAAVLRALDLPANAGKLRGAGVPEADVRSSLGAMKDAGVSAGEATEVTEATVADVAAHGPVDNFGAFVQEKLASGLRGRELAAAIAAEHQARGKGKPAGGPPGHQGPGEHGGGKPGDQGGGAGHGNGAGGKPDGAGPGEHGPRNGGRPENAGEGGGRPADAGHGGGHGKPDDKEKGK